MAELSEGWNGPMEVAIMASGPRKTEDGKQWTGAYPPFTGVPMWDVRCKTPFGDKILVFHSDEKPVDGDVLQGAFIENKPKKDKNKAIVPGKFVVTLYTAEQRESKKSAGGGGYGGGKSNYSLEQEAYRDGQIAAITAIQGGLVGGDGKDLEMTVANIRKVAPVLAKDILDAGKKD